MVIGLSGKYCSGKNAAATIFEGMQIPSIDVDKLGHLALESEIGRIEKEFGSRVIQEEESCKGGAAARTVDRKALGEIVFAEPEKLKALESIIHPWMVSETERRIREYTSGGSRHIVINAAILFKMGLHSHCHCVVWVEAPLYMRIIRALNRDPLNLPAVLKRIYAQRKLKPKPLEKYVDIYRIVNKSGMDSLRMEIRSVLDLIEQKGSHGR
ncbi:MAG: dephospho-CoA kinase [Spirochaetales bacterium]|nr:dephospho-CoA kinase [Spirochaetales bacterium]